MDNEQRAIAYRHALAGHGLDIEVELAKICASIPPDWAENAWEGALLAEVTPQQLRAVVAAENWPAAAALADLAGEDPWSRVVQYNRAQWAKWSPPESE